MLFELSGNFIKSQQYEINRRQNEIKNGFFHN